MNHKDDLKKEKNRKNIYKRIKTVVVKFAQHEVIYYFKSPTKYELTELLEWLREMKSFQDGAAEKIQI